MDGILVEDLVEPRQVAYDGHVLYIPPGVENEISNV